MAVLPTREDIENTLQAHVGEGKNAMLSALNTFLDTFGDLDDWGKSRIRGDLDSYLPYTQEETE